MKYHFHNNFWFGCAESPTQIESFSTAEGKNHACRIGLHRLGVTVSVITAGPL